MYQRYGLDPYIILGGETSVERTHTVALQQVFHNDETRAGRHVEHNHGRDPRNPFYIAQSLIRARYNPSIQHIFELRIHRPRILVENMKEWKSASYIFFD
jgi:hypothetical protein